MLILALLPVAFATSGEVAPGADQRALPAPDVHAKFGWAPGDRWAVTFERTTSRSGTGAPRQETRTTARWTATATSGPGGLEVWTTDYTLDPMTGFPADDLSGAYTAAMFAAAPSFRLLPMAELGELLDLPAARVASDQVLDANSFLAPQARVEVRKLMPDAQVAALVADWWGSLVAIWVDAEMTRGVSIPSRAEVPIPVLGNVLVGLDLTYTYEGTTPCTAGGPATCDLFVTRSTLDPTGLAAGIEAYTNAIASAQRGGAQTAMRLESYGMDSTARLVTEADDLRPRSLVIERVTRMRGKADAQSFEVEQAETRTWTFTPLPEGASAAPAGAPPTKTRPPKKGKAP